MTTQLPKIVAESFSEFFAALNKGHEPFSWQTELLSSILKTGQWPDSLAVPTGGGKSSVVDIHIFANACALTQGIRIPRRLSVVVNRRALVDSQVERAAWIQEQLDAAQPGDGILWDVASVLAGARVQSGSSAIEVGHLRGGLSDRSLPVNDPSAVAVIGATPEMWGSRALFRGYGSSKYARPRETAILTLDSVMVLDEAHLNRQLLATARRISQIQTYYPTFGIPGLQVVETTATPSSTRSATSVTAELDEPKTAADDLLFTRFHSNKQLKLVVASRWNGKPGNAEIVQLAIEHAKQAKSGATRTVGCILNHVDSAIKVAEGLRKTGLKVELLVGRMRPWDVAEMKRRRPGLLEPVGNPEVDVVVATQTLEVGIDADFEHLVTELAPGTALTQRFGRLNRLGDFPNSTATVLVPDIANDIGGDPVPYLASDLTAALRWLNEIGDGGSINPDALKKQPAPAESLRRPGLKRVELMDLELFSRTSMDLFAEPDLDLWLSDDLDDERAMAGVVVRDNLPKDDAAAVELLKLLPPEAAEVFPAPIGLAENIRSKLVLDATARFKRELSQKSAGEPRHYRAFVLRRGEIFLSQEDDGLQPGDVLVIDRGMAITSACVVTEKPTDREAPVEVLPEHVQMVSTLENAFELETLSWHKLFVGFDSESATAEWNSAGRPGKVICSQGVSFSHGVEVVDWFVVFDEPVLPEQAEISQEWTASSGPVTLESHQSAVAERASKMAAVLGLQEDVAACVVESAIHHDDGKVFSQFQRMLGRTPDEPALAKSRTRNQIEAQQARRTSGLPLGWRHEQYSASLLYESMQNDASLSMDGRLSLHLVGASHGRGRPSFPHTSRELYGTDSGSQPAKAVSLFDDGVWDDNFYRLNRFYGVYMLSYLESLERAADAQISMEGR